MVNKVRALCLEGGFNSRKFTNNDADGLKVISHDLRKDGLKDKDEKLGNFTDDKALGVKLNIKNDTLGFIIKMNDKTEVFLQLSAAYMIPLVWVHHFC